MLPSPHCEVLFCYATISERLSCVWFPVYDLDCLLDSEFSAPDLLWILPALFTEYAECFAASPIQSLTLTLILPCLRCVWSLWLNSACLTCITLLIKLHMDPMPLTLRSEDFATYRSSSLVTISPRRYLLSYRTCYPATTAEPSYLSHGGAGKVSASSSSPSTQHERFPAAFPNARIHRGICNCQPSSGVSGEVWRITHPEM